MALHHEYRPSPPLALPFYLKPTLEVARALLGKVLVRRYRGSFLAGMIVEVEAYHGFDDQASHAYKRTTGRSEIMYRRGGIAYVYFTYGMYHCLNVVTEKEGYPAAVLIRALEPVAGINVMERLRKTKTHENLASGPGKLCMAMNITREQNGLPLTGNELFITRGKKIPSSMIATSGRIGVTKSTEKPWRFFIKGNGFVSHHSEQTTNPNLQHPIKLKTDKFETNSNTQ